MVRDWQYCNLCTGETPLIHAARQGHTDTAKFLIEHGADPSIASNLGATALHHSAGIGESLSLSRFPITWLAFFYAIAIFCL